MSAPADQDPAPAHEPVGCPGGRAAGMLARLVLGAVLAPMGSAGGCWLQGLMAPAAAPPYEGAALGAAAGLVAGLVLAWRGTRVADWRGRVADLTLIVTTAIWLLGIALQTSRGVPHADVAAAWLAAVAAAIAVAALAR